MSDTAADEIERVMIDIETLGLEPGAAILSLGAVRFDTSGVWDEFYREISLESCQEAGLTIDAGTLEWWLQQPDSVSQVLVGGDSLADVLVEFIQYYGEADEVWANSPAFDCALLEAAYDALDGNEPWGYADARDVRTVRNLPVAVDAEMEGEEHNALDDAKWQAWSVSETLDALQSGGRQK